MLVLPLWRNVSVGATYVRGHLHQTSAPLYVERQAEEVGHTLHKLAHDCRGANVSRFVLLMH